AIRVDPPRGLEVVKADALDVAPDSGARVVDQRRRVAHLRADPAEGLADRRGIRGITGVGTGVPQLFGQLAREVGAPREQCDGHSLVREGTRQCGAVPFPHSDDGTYGFAHGGSLSSLRFVARPEGAPCSAHGSVRRVELTIGSLIL